MGGTIFFCKDGPKSIPKGTSGDSCVFEPRIEIRGYYKAAPRGSWPRFARKGNRVAILFQNFIKIGWPM